LFDYIGKERRTLSLRPAETFWVQNVGSKQSGHLILSGGSNECFSKRGILAPFYQLTHVAESEVIVVLTPP
jgi:hypothetical protein